MEIVAGLCSFCAEHLYKIQLWFPVYYVAGTVASRLLLSRKMRNGYFRFIMLKDVLSSIMSGFGSTIYILAGNINFGANSHALFWDTLVLVCPSLVQQKKT